MMLAIACPSRQTQASPKANPKPQAKSVSSDSLQTLQTINPIDRRKIKLGVLEKIIQSATNSLSDMTVTVSRSKATISELNGLKDSFVIVVSGKTKYPFDFPGGPGASGTTYPPGLNREIVYSDSGQVLRFRTSSPNPDRRLKPPAL